MALAVPIAFECPITLDIMTDPVKTNCFDKEPNQSSLIKRIFKVFFNTIFFKNAQREIFEGHYFEKLALATHLRQNNQNCPLCNKKITKVIFDKNLANIITKEFTNLSPEHKKHFEDAKREVLNCYGNMVDQDVVPLNRSSTENESSCIATDRASFRSNSDGLFNSLSPLFRAFHPPRASDSSKYSRVSNHILNSNLILAENEADTIISSYYRDKAYSDIGEKYLSLYPDLTNNYRRSSRNIQKAIDVCEKIIDRQKKSDLDYKIVQKIISSNLAHLALAEKAALLIPDRDKKNKALEKIADIHISKYLQNKNESDIKNGIRIANAAITNHIIQQRVLLKAINTYIANLKLKKAINVNCLLSSVSIKDVNKKHIAKCYVDRNFNDKNFQKAIKISNQILDISTKDHAYNIIATKAASSLAYLKSLKTISNVSTFAKRLYLYIKVTSIVIFSIPIKVIMFPFKLGYLSSGFLLTKFKSFFNWIISSRSSRG